MLVKARQDRGRPDICNLPLMALRRSLFPIGPFQEHRAGTWHLILEGCYLLVGQGK